MNCIHYAHSSSNQGSHPTSAKKKEPCKARLLFVRREGDSNPRYVSVNTLSKRARSATLPPLHRNKMAKIEKIQVSIQKELGH